MDQLRCIFFQSPDELQAHWAYLYYILHVYSGALATV